MKKKNLIHLDKEESEIAEAFEKGQFKSVSSLQRKKDIARAAASNTLRKDARVNIRISGADLLKIKQKAAFEGLPYQTLMASILHKYAAGHLENA